MHKWHKHMCKTRIERKNSTHMSFLASQCIQINLHNTGSYDTFVTKMWKGPMIRMGVRVQSARLWLTSSSRPKGIIYRWQQSKHLMFTGPLWDQLGVGLGVKVNYDKYQVRECSILYTRPSGSGPYHSVALSYLSPDGLSTYLSPDEWFVSVFWRYL